MYRPLFMEFLYHPPFGGDLQSSHSIEQVNIWKLKSLLTYLASKLEVYSMLHLVYDLNYALLLMTKIYI